MRILGGQVARVPREEYKEGENWQESSGDRSKLYKTSTAKLRMKGIFEANI